MGRTGHGSNLCRHQTVGDNAAMKQQSEYIGPAGMMGYLEAYSIQKKKKERKEKSPLNINLFKLHRYTRAEIQ